MLCPRCQSDNKPGARACWNCLSPMEGTLAQQFAQKPPDPAAAGAAGTQQNKGGAFWAGIGVLSFLLFVGSLFFFWNLSSSARKALPADAQPVAATPAPAPADNSTAGGTTAGAATAGTAGTTGSTSDNSTTTTTTTSGDSSAPATGGNKAINAALSDKGG